MGALVAAGFAPSCRRHAQPEALPGSGIGIRVPVSERDRVSGDPQMNRSTTVRVGVRSVADVRPARDFTRSSAGIERGGGRSRGVPGIMAASLFALSALIPGVATAEAETWRGLAVAPEDRCSEYDRERDYPYSSSVEPEIVRELGAVYGPYTGRCFESIRETDIEHVVATSEAHDSGLCAGDPQIRARFSSDLRNLTLAAPRVNRVEKKGKDAAEWMPERNRCWFAARVVEVRRAYGLTVDRREADALESVLRDCATTEMEPIDCGAASATGDGASPHAADDDGVLSALDDGVLSALDDDGNGRITCAEARRHGIAPVRRGDPAYPFLRDSDGDGVVCE